MNRVVLACFICFLLSCERAIEFAPKHAEPKLVVEGVIEDGKYPVVYLSRSLKYFSAISTADLVGSFVRNATVTVSDGHLSQTLHEHELQVGPQTSIIYYTVDTSNPDAAFKGKIGGTYTLRINDGGNEYEAHTTIPPLAKTISRLYYLEDVDEDDSAKVMLFAEFIDPPGYGNYTRYFTKTGDGPFLSGLNSVFDDQVVDGQTYNMQVEQGVDRNSDIDFEEYAFFYKGDDITVKYCNIDKAVYDFWRTMEYSYLSIGNPFASPTRVRGNISNGALGYFGGYAVQYSKIVIPE